MSPAQHNDWITPDAVALQLPLATVGSRGAAYLLDQGIVSVGLLAIGAAELAFGITGFVPGWLGLALLLLLAFVLQFGYWVAFETLWRGRTPGKAALGLRVVTVEGAAVGVRHAAIRVTTGLFELQATLGLIAVVTAFVSRRSQRLGDLAAGTIVVTERRRAAMPVAERFEPHPDDAAWVASLDVTGVDTSTYSTIRDTLRRVEQLPAHVADRICAEVADRVADRVRTGRDGRDARRWLVGVAAAVQQRAGTTMDRHQHGPVQTSPTQAPPAGHDPRQR